MTTRQRIDKEFNFKHFDATLLDAIENEALRDNRIDGILWAVMWVCDLSDKALDFKFDKSSIAQIEQFLREKHMRRVIQWGEGAERLTPKRIFTTAGLKTSSAKHIRDYEVCLTNLGWLYTYCMAKVLKAQIVESNGTYAIQHEGVTTYAIGKVFKFLRYGMEDSLVNFCAVTEVRAASEDLRNKLIDELKKMYTDGGDVLPNDSRSEVWYGIDSQGNIEGTPITKVALVTSDGVELCSLNVVQSGGAV